jgi:hypothetical protein
MLQSAAARGVTDQTCLIWRAFAQFGVGDGADAAIGRNGRVSITESFALPASCS